MATVSTAGWVVCGTCGAPHPPEPGCDNPACPDNAGHSPERRLAILERIAAAQAERAEREARARAWARSVRGA